jgi:hypothetical protein
LCPTKRSTPSWSGNAHAARRSLTERSIAAECGSPTKDPLYRSSSRLRSSLFARPPLS